jgi:universal stress protein A
MKLGAKRVLAATDFSDAADAALEWAVDIATTSHGSLYVLHVPEAITGAEPLTSEIDTRAALERAVEARAWQEVGQVVSENERTHLRVEITIEWGIPVDEIVRYVSNHQIDLICVGDRGPDHPPELLLGHVAEGVVRDAPCSVLTIRRGRERRGREKGREGPR